MTLLSPIRRVGRLINPLVLFFAPRIPPFAVVRHVGRRSGRPYRTPVQAFRIPEGFIVGLAFGSDVDWARNILAAGRAEIDRGGDRYSVSAPDLLCGEAGRGELPGPMRPLMRAFRVDSYLVLRVTYDEQD